MAMAEIDVANDVAELDTLPQSWEAEQALLGALLYENEIFHRVSEIVKADDFYNPVNAKIYAQISMLIGTGQLADAIVLKDRFSADSTIEDIGGVEYLALLLANAPASANLAAPEYAKIIKGHSVRRELISFSGDVSERAKALDSEIGPQDQIEAAESALFALAETGSTGRKVKSMGQALVGFLDSVTAAFNRDGHISGLSTGLARLDKQISGLNKSDLIILAGRPSMGKTALATNIAFHVAKAFKEQEVNGVMKTVNGGRVYFASLEMSAEQLVGRMVAEQSRVPNFRMRSGNITVEEYERIRDASDDINNIPLYIDDRGGRSIGQLAVSARRQKRMTGLDLIVVDYLQLLHDAGRANRGGNRTEEVTQITMGLKALAKDLDVPVLALAQLSRAVEQRDNKKPQLSDLRESGSIEQDADVVAFCYREEYYVSRTEPDEGSSEHIEWMERMEKVHGKAQVIIGKQRHGPIGEVNLGFIDELTKFYDLEEEQ